jgi:farnesyl-diphosphate farnesyltransferase
MTEAHLHGPILKSVSRSFYLSIRLLPQKVRGPIGLAYLLARTSDTIADTENAPPQTRLRRLADFEELIRGGPSSDAVTSIQRDIQPDHPGEQRLIEALPELLEAFWQLEIWERNETSLLMAKIIRGQSNDLKTFTDRWQIVALRTAAELEEYTYLVAGCVGEWWTRICFHHLPKYSRMPEADLTPLANSFGKALQLVNILRDLPVDLAAGRCYLPSDELAAKGIAPQDLRENPRLAQPLVDHWIQHARHLLNQGRLYITAVSVRRIRLACYLPWRLAGKTLELLEKQSPLETETKLKVPRSTVRAALWEGLRVAFTNKAF